MDDSAVILLDIRSPCVPVATLSSHDACVNGVSWAPHSASHIATAGMHLELLPHLHSCLFLPLGDDKRALIWDIRLPKVEAILAYEAGGPINQVSCAFYCQKLFIYLFLRQIQWSSAHTDWIGICFDHQLEILRV